MSKPKPGLGKGIVRTLAVAQHPHHSGAVLTLAPVVGPYQHHPPVHGYSTSAASSTSIPPAQGQSSGSLYGPANAPPGWPGTKGSVSWNSTAWSSQPYVSLLPTWDQSDIVLPYAPSRSPTPRQARLFSTLRNGSTGIEHPRRYSSVSVSTSAFLTSPPPPSFFFDRSTGFSPPTAAQTSLDALLSSLEIANGSNAGSGSDTWTGWHGQNSHHSFDSPPTYPSAPGPNARGSPQQPLKALRPSETHTVLSAPLPQNDSSNHNNPVSLTPHPLLALRESSTNSHQAAAEPAGNTSTSSYSSSLIFHLGASGLPKERIPSPRSRKERPPTPPRARSFPLPDVEAPSSLTSVSVGEDAYFARPDGMCIADGVGGWSRSGKDGADAGRWSRLLTHFCEEEVSDWWAGKEVYLVAAKPKPNTIGKRASESSTSSDAQGKQTEKKQGWAKELWEDRQHNLDAKQKEEAGRERRPLDPVEIMQRGFEKCLACVLTEGVHGSSTCLLALLYHSTLHIANLGDCCLLLIRKGEVVFRTSEMQHAFNFPLQVGTHSRDEPMKDAQRHDVPVKKGDVVVLGSDGLMDNLFDEDILDIVTQFVSPGGEVNTDLSVKRDTGFPPFNPQHISDALCRKARSVSELVTSTTPFMAKAIDEGIDFVGGKKDDISVLVGVIGDRDDARQSENRPGEAGGANGGLRLHL
ncbi:hypothetical protein IAU60_000224 [Kwoniella sp. DSM 27419]